MQPISKTCSKCKKTKPVQQFSKSSRRKDGRQDWCKECTRIRDKERYHESKEQHKKWNKTRVDKNFNKVTDYLCTNKCADCGESDPVVLEFDHRDPSKKVDDIANMIRYASWKRIEKEMKKCDVVCANCHKRRTAKKFKWKRYTRLHKGEN
jgi:hypothetical protein